MGCASVRRSHKRLHVLALDEIPILSSLLVFLHFSLLSSFFCNQLIIKGGLFLSPLSVELCDAHCCHILLSLFTHHLFLSLFDCFSLQTLSFNLAANSHVPYLLIEEERVETERQDYCFIEIPIEPNPYMQPLLLRFP